MFSDVIGIVKFNTKYINLEQIEQYLIANKEKIELKECWLTPFYITKQKTYEFYHLKLVMYRNMSFEEYISGEINYEFPLSSDIISLRKACYINIDDTTSLNKQIEQLMGYLLFIKENKEIVNTAIDLFGDFDASNIFFEYIE